MNSDTAAVQCVEDFLFGLAANDIATCADLVTDDIEWHNVGLPKVKGKPKVMGALKGMLKNKVGFDVVIHHIAATPDGSVVLTERTDVITKGVRAEFWVCGTFELRDGKIAVWRDYFAHHNVAKGALVGLVTLARSSLGLDHRK